MYQPVKPENIRLADWLQFAYCAFPVFCEKCFLKSHWNWIVHKIHLSLGPSSGKMDCVRSDVVWNVHQQKVIRKYIYSPRANRSIRTTESYQQTDLMSEVSIPMRTSDESKTPRLPLKKAISRLTPRFTNWFIIILLQIALPILVCNDCNP